MTSHQAGANAAPGLTIQGMSQNRTRARFVILALISVGTMINYLDRTILGIAAPSLSKDLALSPPMMGVVFSAFAWTYAAAQVPGGVFLDRYGCKLTYFLSLSFWSLFTLLQAFALGLYSLLFFRFGLGVSEAPCFPTNSRTVGLGWTLISDMAPKHLMGMTGGLFNFVTNLSGIFTPIIIGFIISATGSFFGALFFIGAVALFGAFAYIFILGDVKRLEVE